MYKEKTEKTVVKMKICGLRTREDAEAVNAVLPEYTGFIFDSTRKRYIAPEKAEEIRQLLDPSIHPIGVFVNAGTEEILGVLQQCRLDMVQLHGDESDVEIEELRVAVSEAFPERKLTIVKAFRVDSKGDVERAEKSAADLILLDHGAGGTGESFDWNLLKECRREFFLAGGLAPENVRTAIELARPWGVDASSSLETDGHKDPEKIRRFAEAVRYRNR
jgi:phosphoribosylanthranilate isomerase